MNLLKKIGKQLFGSRTTEITDPDDIYLYFKCQQCGAPVRVRVDRQHDLHSFISTDSADFNRQPFPFDSLNPVSVI